MGAMFRAASLYLRYLFSNCLCRVTIMMGLKNVERMTAYSKAHTEDGQNGSKKVDLQATNLEQHDVCTYLSSHGVKFDTLCVLYDVIHVIRLRVRCAAVAPPPHH